MKRLFVIIMSILCICSCSSKYERGAKILHNANVDRATRAYYSTFAKGKSDPVAFAKEIAEGSYNKVIKDWYPTSGKVSVKEALENRWIRYGMTYEQLQEIIGPAGRLSKSGGQIIFAYYNDLSFQFCFNNGRLYNWNEN